MKAPKYQLVIVSNGSKTAILYNGKTLAKHVESCSFTADGSDVDFRFTQEHVAGMDEQYADPSVFIECANHILGEAERKQLFSQIPILSRQSHA